MKRLLMLLAFSAILFADKIYYEEDLEPKEAYEMMQKGAILIDVRTPAEYIYAGHPIGAISIPIFDYLYRPKPIELRVKFAQKEKTRELNAHMLYDITYVENKNFLQDVKKVIKLVGKKKILVICRTGARSRYAANILAKNGLKDIYNIEGGFLAWKKAKLPLVTE